MMYESLKDKSPRPYQGMLIYDLALEGDQLLLYGSCMFYVKGCVLGTVDVVIGTIVNGKIL